MNCCLLLTFFNLVKWCSFLGMLKKLIIELDLSRLRYQWIYSDCSTIQQRIIRLVVLIVRDNQRMIALTYSWKNKTGNQDHFGSCYGKNWPCAVEKNMLGALQLDGKMKSRFYSAHVTPVIWNIHYFLLFFVSGKRISDISHAKYN